VQPEVGKMLLAVITEDPNRNSQARLVRLLRLKPIIANKEEKS
jgi:hypothetical protein